MNRRDLLKALAYGGVQLGLGGGMSLALPKVAQAATGDHYWVFVSAGGGWDVTNMWDPKGSEVIFRGGAVNSYSQNDIRQVGNIRYAPVPPNVTTQDMLQTFTQKYFNNMLVINGVNQGTNGHTIGTRVSLAGSSDNITPIAAAMLAEPLAKLQSMAFIARGAYNYTGGIVPATRLLSRADYQRLVTPDLFLDSANAFTELNLQKRALLQQLISGNTQNFSAGAMQQLAEARSSSVNATNILSFLPDTPNTNSNLADTEMIAAAFKAGNATSATLRINGFDTHQNNDQRQFTQMDQLLTLVDYLWNQLEVQGIADRTTVVMASEFSRLPTTRDDLGKDHWPISSMVFMGAGITGNRVIGATDDGLNALPIDPNTLALSDTGLQIKTASIYDAFRRMSGLSGSPTDLLYPLNADFINFFA